MALPADYSFGILKPKDGTSGFFVNDRDMMRYLVETNEISTYANFYNELDWNSNSSLTFWNLDGGTGLYNLDTAAVQEWAFQKRIRDYFVDDVSPFYGGMHSWIETLANDMAANPSTDYEIKISASKPVV